MKLLNSILGQESFVRYFSLVSSLVFVLTVGLSGVFFNKLPIQIPLFYSRPWGQDQLATNVWFLFTPLFLSVFFLVLNIFLSLKVFKNFQLLKITLLVGGLLCVVLSCITVVKIIFLVI